MGNMKKVTRYQCQFCKKDFKTPDKHHCKFNPELRNCFTCKHLKGWIDGEEYPGDYYREPNYPDCNVDIDGWDIGVIKGCNYNMQCNGYEEDKYDWSLEGDEDIVF